MRTGTTCHSRVEQELILLSAGTTSRRRAMQTQIEELGAVADWTLLAELLQRRRLLPLLGPRLVDLAGHHSGDDFAGQVAKALDASRRHGAFLQLITERIIAALSSAKVRCTALKGAALSQALYGDLGRRPSTDIDLLVEQGQLNAAAEIVRELGYGVPTDYVDWTGLPRLHLALTHDHLPPVELHWRVHWYEDSFASDRLLAPSSDLNGTWRPAAADDFVALLLFYARDGFVDLRHATDLGAFWDVYGASLASFALDQATRAYPALENALLTAVTVAARTVGLPPDRLTEHTFKLSRRGRTAVRLSNTHLQASQPQIYANIGLIDGLLTPAGGFCDFIRRQVIPPREVLRARAKRARRPQASSPIGHGVRVLGRYGLAMIHLLLPSESLRLDRSGRHAQRAHVLRARRR
jgi:hypothetical protein